ncbi:hypothetical protein BGX28_000959 [Mortierella sp. GBA30]|nr:hypothetical protein BGX28_000959 [Mortierella sp. GBA30]
MPSSAINTAVPTNTVTITNLNNAHFEQAPLEALRAQAETFGQVCFFSPIKSFKRIFVVYRSIDEAKKAKSLHNTLFKGTTLRVYFGQHTELSIDPERYYLHLPEKNAKTNSDPTGLVSPPGSPPLGHVMEDEDMPAIDDGFSLEGPASYSPLTPTVTLPTPSECEPAEDPSGIQLRQQIRKLRIDTHRNTKSTLTAPSSPVSPSSSLYPTTPTLLAFSPAKESQGEQPFITIQDWGVEHSNGVSVSNDTPVMHTLPSFATFTRCY